MRTLRLIGIAIVVVLIGMSLTACSDDDDDNKDDEPLTNPTSNKINGHEYVDLGLSVKWATCNVGAEEPSDYGDYFAWGEIEPKSEYTEENSLTYYKNLGSIAGISTYDAATANWGSPWRMPTEEEMEELINKCEREWTTQEGYNGYKVTGPNGNSIFLPAAGFHLDTSFNYAGVAGRYWNATPNEEGTEKAYALCFDSRSFFWGADLRYLGRSVRPVTE